MNADQIFTVFDVESVGLHGQAFAVAVHTFGPAGVLYEHLMMCDPSGCEGDPEDLEWVLENCRPQEWRSSVDYSFSIRQTPLEVRQCFWEYWMRVQTAYPGVLLAADVPWPVEARFLAACIDDNVVSRKWLGPYPIIDVASVRFAAGFDALADEERKENEQPAHHPLADCRQSARLLREALAKCNGAQAIWYAG